ncbi:hypothetical protein DRO59_08765 [Candidatus Bathyarchaeota archaeon]|nr:MAG: hypothetical protein DRO59_08765 [Candidatus Bathyarchaeota archaeon]
MKLVYPYVEDGYAAHGEKIPDIPVVHLMLKVGKFTGRGPAIIDTGFDGGIYPNMEIIRMFEGLEPKAKANFENPLFGVSEFEVYTAEAFLHSGTQRISLGEVRVYVPTEPELVTGEVLLGREIINEKIKSLIMNAHKGYAAIEL